MIEKITALLQQLEAWAQSTESIEVPTNPLDDLYGPIPQRRAVLNHVRLIQHLLSSHYIELATLEKENERLRKELQGRD